MAKSREEHGHPRGVDRPEVTLAVAVRGAHDRLDGMRRRVEASLSRRYDFQSPKAEELLRLGEGYDLARVELGERSPCINRELRQLDLPSWMVQVLAIERGPEFKPVPRGNDRLLLGDALIVYGAADAINKVFKPRKSTKLTVMGTIAPDTVPL